MKSYRSEIERLIPFLRQFARALVAVDRPDVADELVHDTIAEALRAEVGAAVDDVLARMLTRLIGINRSRGRQSVSERRTAPTAGGEGRPAHQTFGYAGSDSAHGLEHLPLNDREALLLVVLGKLDYPQAAAILGIPVATLITRLVNAREALGSALWRESQAGTAMAPPVGRPVGQVRHLRLIKS